jgi:hypothetical protein
MTDHATLSASNECNLPSQGNTQACAEIRNFATATAMCNHLSNQHCLCSILELHKLAINDSKPVCCAQIGGIYNKTRHHHTGSISNRCTANCLTQALLHMLSLLARQTRSGLWRQQHVAGSAAPEKGLTLPLDSDPNH